MIVILSPAKKLTEKDTKVPAHTIPQFMVESETLMGKLKTLKPNGLVKLMKISDKLAELNYNRNQEWNSKFNEQNAHPAALSFDGEVYWGLEAETFKKGDFNFAQKHLRILSGLHGVLKPLDLIKPYRLEMGSKIKVGKNKNLYEFWADKITESLAQDLKATKSKHIVQLASNEYFKSVNTKNLDAEVITMHFKDLKNGVYKPLFAYVKRARGHMAAFIVKNRLKKIEDCKAFDSIGYCYNPKLSEGKDWVFTRDKVQ